MQDNPAVRDALRDEPVQYPMSTQFDNDAGQKTAYRDGFTTGWHSVLQQGPGALHSAISIPQNYQNQPQMASAWHQGYVDGGWKAWNLVQSKAGQSK